MCGDAGHEYRPISQTDKRCGCPVCKDWYQKAKREESEKERNAHLEDVQIVTQHAKEAAGVLFAKRQDAAS